jgi:type II secretion system protein H
MGQIRSRAEPELMRILGIGKKSNGLIKCSSAESGFTLIELLLALTIVAVMLGIAVLTIPNHDERYWRDNLDQLVASLNAAQDESLMSGSSMLAQIDEAGWRFSRPLNLNPMAEANTPATFIPDAYKAKVWAKPVIVSSMQLTLGAESVTTAMRIPIQQDKRFATLVRASNGRFSWESP